MGALRLTLAQEPVVVRLVCHQRDPNGKLHDVPCLFVAGGDVELVDGQCIWWDAVVPGCERPGGRWDEREG